MIDLKNFKDYIESNPIDNGRVDEHKKIKQKEREEMVEDFRRINKANKK